jgi:hypothetical protein
MGLEQTLRASDKLMVAVVVLPGASDTSADDDGVRAAGKPI